MAKKKLDAREKIFHGEYLIDLDPTRAALAAGYSKTMARTKAYQWVSNSKVKPHLYEAIQKSLNMRLEKLDVTPNRVLEEISKMAFSNMLDYMEVGDDGYAYTDFSKLTRDQAAAIQELNVETYVEPGENGKTVKKIRFKLADKKGNLELLGKHLAMWTEKREITGPNGGPIQTEMTPNEAARRVLFMFSQAAMENKKK